MKQNTGTSSVEKKKVILVNALFAFSVAIVLSGSFFIVFSLVNQISFIVLNSSIHGAIFGALVTYLGIRNFLAVKKLKTEVYKHSSRFSWNNFKKARPNRLAPRSR